MQKSSRIERRSFFLKEWSSAAGWTGEEEAERKSGAKQQALNEKRCEIETNKSRTDSYSCVSHRSRNMWPHQCSLLM